MIHSWQLDQNGMCKTTFMIFEMWRGEGGCCMSLKRPSWCMETNFPAMPQGKKVSKRSLLILPKTESPSRGHPSFDSYFVVMEKYCLCHIKNQIVTCLWRVKKMSPSELVGASQPWTRSQSEDNNTFNTPYLRAAPTIYCSSCLLPPPLILMLLFRGRLWTVAERIQHICRYTERNLLLFSTCTEVKQPGRAEEAVSWKHHVTTTLLCPMDVEDASLKCLSPVLGSCGFSV